MGELRSVTTAAHAANLEGLRRELAALQVTIAQSICPRDPDMLRMSEAKLVQLARDINLLERRGTSLCSSVIVPPSA